MSIDLVASNKLPRNGCLGIVASKRLPRNKKINGIRVASKVSYCCSVTTLSLILELSRTPPTVVLPTSQWWDGTTLRTFTFRILFKIGSLFNLAM